MEDKINNIDAEFFKFDKPITSRYATHMVDNKFYNEVNIKNQDEIKYLSEEELKEGKQGYILAPYMFVSHTEESLKEYREFMDIYHNEHKYCPKCGSESCWTTLVGYVKQEGKEYKDLNKCTCTTCGDVHTCHERVKEKIA